MTQREDYVHPPPHTFHHTIQHKSQQQKPTLFIRTKTFFSCAAEWWQFYKCKRKMREDDIKGG